MGKSSLVNSLKRSRAVGVSSTPGFTKSIQQVRLDAHINLLDSPGVMFSDETNDGELVLRNCLKIEHIADPVTVAYTIVSKCTTHQLCSVYGIEPFRSGDEFLMAVAKKRGKLGKAGVPNLVETARTVIQVSLAVLQTICYLRLTRLCVVLCGGAVCGGGLGLER